MNQDKQDNQDDLKFLSPENWVFHGHIADRVKTGEYQKIMPYSAEFVTTLNCTNRCQIPCAYQPIKVVEGVQERNDFRNPYCHMPSTEFALGLLDKIIDGGVNGIIFTGGGEPFMFSGLETLIAHVKQRGGDSVLYTNGNFPSPERVRKAIEGGLKLARVSLSDANEQGYIEFHKPLNPRGALQRAIGTIEELARGSLRNPDMTLGIGVVINRINKDHLVETAEKIREISDKTKGGINFVTFRPAFDYYSSNQLPAALLDAAHETVEGPVRKILQEAGIKVANVHCRYEALKENTRDYKECRSTGLYVEVTPSGKLCLCCDRNFNRGYIIGDLTKQTLEEIWNGEERKSVLEHVNSRKCNICPPACKSHETNRLFERLEKMRRAGKTAEIRDWIDEHASKPKPKMFNF